MTDSHMFIQAYRHLLRTIHFVIRITIICMQPKLNLFLFLKRLCNDEIIKKRIESHAVTKDNCKPNKRPIAGDNQPHTHMTNY